MNRLVRFVVLEATMLVGLYFLKNYGKQCAAYWDLFKSSVEKEEESNKDSSDTKNRDKEAKVEEKPFISEQTAIKPVVVAKEVVVAKVPAKVKAKPVVVAKEAVVAKVPAKVKAKPIVVAKEVVVAKPTETIVPLEVKVENKTEEIKTNPVINTEVVSEVKPIVK